MENQVPVHPPSDVEAASLLDDWLASAGGGVAPPRPAAPAPSIVAATPANLLDALSTDASIESKDAGPAPGAATDPGAAAVDSLVLFMVAGSTYGVLETSVVEVTRVPKITPVPHTPAWVRGVTNLRGDIVSVVDVRLFLGLDPTSTHTGRLLVVRLLNEELAVGLLVDRVDQIASVPREDVRPPVSPVEGALAAFLAGVCQRGDRFITVLDLDRLLRSPEIRQFESQRPTEE